MPRNGSGQYDLPYDWNDDKDNGIKVLASRMQAQDQDIANALTGSLAADGQTPLTGDLDCNNNKLVDLADGSDAGDSVNVSQVQTGEFQYYGISTTTPAGTDGEDYDLGPSPTFIVYPPYARFSFTCHFTCIANPNIRFGTLVTKNLVKSDGASGYIALVAGDMVADKEYICSYNEDNSATQIVVENITKATTSVYGVSYLPQPITIANNVSDANNDIDFGAGVFQFDDGSGQAVATALTKRFDATWVAGNNQGGLDTGSKANNTPYYIYAIYNPATLVSDFLATATKGSPTMPSGYTKKKYIGAFFTDGSANIRGGTWTIGLNEYRFEYNISSAIVDVNVSSITTANRTLYNLSCPVSSLAIFTFVVSTTTANNGYKLIYLSNNSQPDNNTVANIIFSQGAVENVNYSQYYEKQLGSTSQIGIRGNAADPDVSINTIGWKEYL